MNGDKSTSTILQRRKKIVKFDKEEILLMLRCYQCYPTNWGHIIDEMKANLERLPGPVRELYTTSPVRKIQGRLSSKLGKLIQEKNIEDDDIRREVEAIKRVEGRTGQSTTSEVPSSSASGSDVRDTAIEVSIITMKMPQPHI